MISSSPSTDPDVIQTLRPFLFGRLGLLSKTGIERQRASYITDESYLPFIARDRMGGTEKMRETEQRMERHREEESNWILLQLQKKTF